MATGLQASEHGELDALLREALKSQYRAALAMLREAVERCPDSLWAGGKPPFWQIAYHAAFFAHYYLGPNDAAFCPWKHHRSRYESLHSPPEPMGEPYTRAQVLDYLSQCAAMVGPMIDALDLTSHDPGFSWYKVSKVEHQIINIRHIQHHAVYLSAALRASGQDPVTWISPNRSDVQETPMAATEHARAVRQLWPLLIVQDIQRSVVFYRDQLGFALAGQADAQGRMFWCRLERGGASIMLQQADAEDGPAQGRGRGVDFYFICDDAGAMYAELTKRGLQLDPPKVAYYGMKQLFVPEPDGYSICFESEIQRT